MRLWFLKPDFMRSAKKAQTQQNKPRKNGKNISDYEIQFNVCGPYALQKAGYPW